MQTRTCVRLTLVSHLNTSEKVRKPLCAEPAEGERWRKRTHKITNSTWIFFLIKKQQGQGETLFQQWKWLSGRPDTDNASSGGIDFLFEWVYFFLPVGGEQRGRGGQFKHLKVHHSYSAKVMKWQRLSLDNWDVNIRCVFWKSSYRAGDWNEGIKGGGRTQPQHFFTFLSGS